MTDADRARPPDDQTPEDFLGLDSPNVTTAHALTRLGLLSLAGAAASFGISLVLALTLVKSAAIDVLVLIAWLGAAVLSVAGAVLLVAAAVSKLVSARSAAAGGPAEGG